MFTSKWLIPAVTAFALGCAGPGLAVEPHAHGDKAAVVKLQLNHGKKWQTDEALRRHPDLEDAGRVPYYVIFDLVLV